MHKEWNLIPHQLLYYNATTLSTLHSSELCKVFVCLIWLEPLVLDFWLTLAHSGLICQGYISHSWERAWHNYSLSKQKKSEIVFETYIANALRSIDLFRIVIKSSQRVCSVWILKVILIIVLLERFFLVNVFGFIFNSYSFYKD